MNMDFNCVFIFNCFLLKKQKMKNEKKIEIQKRLNSKLNENAKIRIVSEVILPFLWLAERDLPSFGWQPVEYPDVVANMRAKK